jgi:hypothetical protein
MAASSSQEAYALLDESFILVDHLRFITSRRTALDRQRVVQCGAIAKRELAQQKQAAIGAARRTAQRSQSSGLTEKLAERQADVRELEAQLLGLLAAEAEVGHACSSAEDALQVAFEDLAAERRRFRDAVSAARLKAERAIAEAEATRQEASSEAKREWRDEAAKSALAMNHALGLA